MADTTSLRAELREAYGATSSSFILDMDTDSADESRSGTPGSGTPLFGGTPLRGSSDGEGGGGDAASASGSLYRGSTTRSGRANSRRVLDAGIGRIQDELQRTVRRIEAHEAATAAMQREVRGLHGSGSRREDALLDLKSTSEAQFRRIVGASEQALFDMEKRIESSERALHQALAQHGSADEAWQSFEDHRRSVRATLAQVRDEIAEQVVTAQRGVSTVRVDLAQMREGIETAHATARRLSTVEARQEGLCAEFCELVSQMQVRNLKSLSTMRDALHEMETKRAEEPLRAISDAVVREEEKEALRRTQQQQGVCFQTCLHFMTNMTGLFAYLHQLYYKLNQQAAFSGKIGWRFWTTQRSSENGVGRSGRHGRARWTSFARRAQQATSHHEQRAPPPQPQASSKVLTLSRAAAAAERCGKLLTCVRPSRRSRSASPLLLVSMRVRRIRPPSQRPSTSTSCAKSFVSRHASSRR